jgi:hypothetical protein
MPTPALVTIVRRDTDSFLIAIAKEIITSDRCDQSNPTK